MSYPRANQESYLQNFCHSRLWFGCYIAGSSILLPGKFSPSPTTAICLVSPAVSHVFFGPQKSCLKNNVKFMNVCIQHCRIIKARYERAIHLFILLPRKPGNKIFSPV
ncbi:hypothetical protein M413DRAFT_195656 [Hebeloma cylindrosporum]|uniref:Uncharacterized protein n=1 Tax=Hebeloma cylindrosporum TaxID=76867 RepID=A0A0C3C6J9_HEBCY|nr:hypothetical protein M413DRAFT_195656 [Hebeloma cylindrosporum h7]